MSPHVADLLKDRAMTGKNSGRGSTTTKGARASTLDDHSRCEVIARCCDPDDKPRTLAHGLNKSRCFRTRRRAPNSRRNISIFPTGRSGYDRRRY